MAQFMASVISRLSSLSMCLTNFSKADLEVGWGISLFSLLRIPVNKGYNTPVQVVQIAGEVLEDDAWVLGVST